MGPVDLLISLDPQAPSEERRKILRQVTDNFMVASDRYDRRETALFDILLSRTANAMNLRLKKLLVMTLIRAGAREEHIRHTLKGVPNPNERFLRRSVMQTIRDLTQILREQAEASSIPDDLSMEDGNTLQLPSALLFWMFHYQLTAYRSALLNKFGSDRVGLMERTAIRFQSQIVEHACEQGREEIIMARRTIADWTRRQSMTEEVLTELLEARAMTEFLLAASHMFSIDAATMIRTVNDISFQSLAILLKAHNIRRATFAKVISGFQDRKTDMDASELILPLYDKLMPEAAERAIRFLRVRTSDIGSGYNDAEQFAAVG